MAVGFSKPTERVNIDPPSGGQRKTGWYQGRVAGVIEEEVTYADDAYYADLTQTLPPGCRVVWATLKNKTGIAVSGDGTGTADSIALVTDSESTTAHTAGSSNIVAIGPTTTSQNAATRGTLTGAETQFTGASTTGLRLYPCDSGGARYLSIATSGSGAYQFDGTGTVHVRVHYEEIDDQYDYS
jgi:hypothetical protein